MLIRLIYASHAGLLTVNADVQAILASSRRFNAARGITGMLCYGERRFLQYIEGRKDEIDHLYYDRICPDRRHKQVVLLDYMPIAGRAFADWSMGYVGPRDVVALPAIHFRPEKFTAAQADQTIRLLKRSLRPQEIVLPDPASLTA